MEPASKRRAMARRPTGPGASPTDPPGPSPWDSGQAASSSTPSSSGAAEDDSASAWDEAWADEGDEEEDEVGFLWGMNIVTGAVRNDASGGAGASEAEVRKERGLVQFSYGTYEGVQLSVAEVRKLKAEERASLLASRKLVLVLDLDHTLLNSATLRELSTEQADAVAAAAGVPKWTVPPEPPPDASPSPAVVAAALVDDDDLIEEEEEEGGEGDASGASGGGDDVEEAAAPSPAAAEDAPGGSEAAPGGGKTEGLHWLAPLGLWTKLRPGLRAFLLALVDKFELYVYTMGARRYAAAVVELLDADGSLGLRGKDRVIANEDSTSRRLKGLDVVLGAEETTLIVDDSAAVWPEHAAQLLVPRRYHYFDASAGRDGSLGKAARGLLSRQTDEPPGLGEGASQLGALLEALTRIHASFFQAVDAAAAAAPPHVKASVAEVRRGVLSGVRLLFTRVIPLEEKRPERHFAWRLALELGATVATSTEEGVTHVVAGAARTDKAQWADRSGRRVVSLGWLTECGYCWRRLDELDFPVGAEPDAAPATARARPSDTLPPPSVG